MGRTSRKISNFFRKIFHKPTVQVGKDRILLYVSLISIVFIAFFIRLFPILLNYPVIKAFDPWFQYHIADYVTENGFWAFFTWKDMQGWYPWGNPMYNNYIGTPFLGAITYQIFNFFGLGFTLYETVIIFPAIMGGLTVIMMYLLGKTIGNRKVGLLAAFFLAICPAYVQRTIAGFFDNETIGVFLMIACLYLFIKAYKEDSVIHSILGGLSVAFFMWSWGAWVYIVDLIPLMAFLLVLMKRYNRKLLKHYSLVIGIGLLVGTRIPGTGVGELTGLTGIVPIGVLILLFCCEGYLILRNNERISNFISKYNWKKILATVLILSAGIILILWLTGATSLITESDIFQELFGVSGRYAAIINPLFQNFIIQSVGEHLPSPWGVYYYNLHILIFVMPIGFYYLFKRGWDEDIIIILFGITTIYFAGTFIRLLLLLGPAASLIGAFGIVAMMRPFSLVFRRKFILARRRKRHANIIARETPVGMAAIFTLLIITTSIHGVYTTAYQLSGSAMVPGGQFHDWEETWSWMKNSLSDNAVVTSWWDYGYWITVAGNTTSSADNGTWNSTQIALIGRMMMATDPYVAINILRMLKSTHVLVYWGYYTGLGGDEGKWVWMVKIGFDHPELNDLTYYYDIEDYYNDTNGLTGPAFFDSTIWGMLTAREYHWVNYEDTAPYREGLWGYFINRIHTAEDSEGNLWKDHIDLNEMTPVQGETDVYQFPDPEFFTLDFMSTNHLIKIFKINYEEADLQGNITDVSLYNSGISYLKFENIGYSACQISDIQVGGSAYEFDIITGNSTIEPGEEVEIRAYGTKYDFNTTQTVNITIQDAATPSITNDKTTTTANVTNSTTYDFAVDETESYLYSNNTAFFPVNNTGNDYIKINSIDISKNDQNFTFSLGQGSTDFYSENGTNGLLNVSEHTRLTISPSSMASKSLNLIPGEVYNVTLKAINENVTKEIESLMVVSQENSLTAFDIEIYANETLQFRLQNTGQDTIKIKDVLLGENILNTYCDPFVDPFDGYSMVPGQISYFNITFPHSRLNLNYSENYYLNFSLNTTLDSKSNSTSQISVDFPPEFNLNVTDDAYSNDTLFVNVENIGNYSVTISDFWINNYPTTNFNETGGGNNHTIDPSENKSFVIQTQYNMNYTDNVNVKARAFEGIENETTSFVNITGSIKIDNSSIYQDGYALVNITNNGTNTVIIQDFVMHSDAIFSEVIEHSPIGLGDGDYILYPNETQEFNLTVPLGIPLSPNYQVDLNVSTYEGAYIYDELSWAIGFEITNIRAYDNGTVNITIYNSGQNNLTFSNSSSLLINGTLIGNMTVNMTENVTVQPGEICYIDAFDLNFTLNNFSQHILVNVSANYTDSNRVYIIPGAGYYPLFILSSQSNISIVEGYPYSLAIDNGTFTKNDSITLTIRNTGSNNVTLDNASLYNSTGWYIFNFTDSSNNTLNSTVLQPYETFTCYNSSISNNDTQANFIELNVTEFLSVRVNCTTSLFDEINLTVLTHQTNITILAENATFGNSQTEKLRLTLVNYGSNPFNIVSIQISNGTTTPENIFTKYAATKYILPGETIISNEMSITDVEPWKSDQINYLIEGDNILITITIDVDSISTERNITAYDTPT